jgi:hypothetical protein
MENLATAMFGNDARSKPAATRDELGGVELAID